MKFLLTFIFLFSLIGNSISQEKRGNNSTNIVNYIYRADRPQMTISGEIVPLKTIAFESGVKMDFQKENNYYFNYNKTLLRIGMMKLMEMTVGLKVPGSLINRAHQTGFASPKLGLKVLMKKKEDGVKMGIAFIFDGSINFGTNNFKDTKFLPSFRVAADVDFSPKTNLRLNYGAEWKENRLVLDSEGNPAIDPFIILGASLNQTLNEHLIIFFEAFASLKYNNFRNDYLLNAGLIYKLKNNIQFDIAGGAGLSPKSPRGNIQIGFSGLWPKKNIPVGSRQ